MKQSLRRSTGAVVLAVALAAVSATAVGSSPRSTAGLARTKPSFTVASTTVTFVDTSRPTGPNGSFPGSPSRTLRTIILYPQSTWGHKVKTAPLIVFAHGVSARGNLYITLTRTLVQAGYVVALPTFPLSAISSPGGPRAADYVNQPADVSFVITEVLKLDKAPGSPLYNLIDDERIGVGGHSLGGFTTFGFFNSCCRDPRVDAAAPIAGRAATYPGGTYFGEAGPPLLAIHGTDDEIVGYDNSVVAFDAAGPPKFLLTLIGGTHVPFRLGPNAPGSPTVYEPIIQSALLAFFDKYLHHGRNGLARLRDAADVPGVATLQEQVR